MLSLRHGHRSSKGACPATGARQVAGSGQGARLEHRASDGALVGLRDLGRVLREDAGRVGRRRRLPLRQPGGNLVVAQFKDWPPDYDDTLPIVAALSEEARNSRPRTPREIACEQGSRSYPPYPRP